jgi:hypothetical protein
MKKMMPGHGPAPVAGVKTEAGQTPSRVVMSTSTRDMSDLSARARTARRRAINAFA